MEKSVCKDCINKEICGKKNQAQCAHYDVVLSRGEIMTMISDAKVKNPNFIPALLNAIKRTYKINLAW
jgi:hypothetical protein